MPTPVNTARQCLTQEGATALDDAATVAKRRGHSQTTSLHMVSSLLSLPNSILREACMHARNNSFNYSSRAQFKALELSLSVSLDRLPSSSKAEEPPVANSLMAAVKRSQANQRRQPENYYGSSSVTASSVPVVKVELKNLILSILDDPLVSRVFGEAGFKSYDVKMSLIRPNFGAYTACYRRYLNSRPTVFSSSFGDGNNNKGFNFPFVDCFSTGGDHRSSKRICEVMVRENKRNPLLLGVGAIDVLASFLETVKRADVKGLLPENLSVITVKDEIFKLVSEDFDEGPLKLKLAEVGKTVGGGHGGVVVNLGDLGMLDGVSVENLRFLVSCVSNSLQAHRGKLWLICAVNTDEVYFKFLGKVSTLEEDWDLETVPIITSSLGAGSLARSNLMESFVPLGGFFSNPSEIKIPLINARVSRCHLCNEKYEQEAASITKRGLYSSVAEQYHSTLPSWLQKVEESSSTSTLKGKDDDDDDDNDSRFLLLNKKIAHLQKKWDKICQEHHHNQKFSKICSPHVVGFKLSNTVNSSLSTDIRRSSSLKDDNSFRKTSDGLKSQASVSSAATNLSVDAKVLYKALVDKIGDLHRENMSTFVQAMARCKAKENGLWMNLKGPDKLFKIKLGLALAEALLPERAESFVYVDLNLQEEMQQSEDTLLNSLRIKNKYSTSMRVTAVEYLVEALSKKLSIVFLENIGNADPVVQSSLSRAMETGKLTDLRGREANIGNCIFLGSERSNEDLLRIYSEEDVITTAKGTLIKMLIRYDLNDDDASDVLRVSDAEGKGLSDTNHLNKRKLMGRSRIAENEGFEVAKRANKSAFSSSSSSDSFLDLNLPAEELQSGSGFSSEDPSKSWLEDFEGAVAFKPFDYDALAEKLYGEARRCLREVLGCKCSMEIERRVMRQFLAAAFARGDEEIVVNWIRNVLRSGFVEAMGKFGLDNRSIVKLVACDGGDEPLAYEGLQLLPPRIVLD